MSIVKEQKGTYCLLRVDAQSLLNSEATQLKEIAQELIQDGVTEISLDLSKTQYIDSSGIGKILFINKKLTSINGTFAIEIIGRKLYEFFDSLAITKVMDIKKVIDS
ncbi:STAS domain-containing protein [Spirochaeta cellobiosiphila]|uniref:STAS domain-containing protein n=1 Tax=Spirochaeta cellobiosiphila TaxID=504483 RepID=UPI0003FBD19C|nr:STAS domain-containing protein [Spirochaeta cellobiosiphila]